MSAALRLREGDRWRGCAVGGPYEPDSPQWAQDRRSYVGASEVASILWQDGDWELWARKSGLLSPWGGNSATRRGHALEAWIIDEYRRARERGHYACEIVTVERALHIDGYPVAVNLDGFDVPVAGVVEAKASTFRRKKAFTALKEDGVEALPRNKMSVAAYWVQVQIQIEAVDADGGVIVVELGDAEPMQIPVKRDRAFASAALDIVAHWWERHMVGHVAPEIRTPVDSDALWEVYPAYGVLGLDDAQLADALAKYTVAHAAEDAARKDAKIHRSAVEARMRELGAVKATVDGKKIGYGKPASRLDTKALRRERPEIVAQYTKTAERGSFAIK